MRTVGTAVEVVAIVKLNNIKHDDLWVAFGDGVHFLVAIIAGTLLQRNSVSICRHRKEDGKGNLGCIPKITVACEELVHSRSC